jgi:hypothetical protein
MRNRRRIRWLLALILSVSGCTDGGVSGEIVYAGWNDLFVIDAGAGRILGEVAIGAKINDLEPAAGKRLLIATTRGLLVVDTGRMTVDETIPLGIVDSIEYDDERDIVYALLHPGDKLETSGGPHKLLRLSGADYRESGRVILEPWAYDIFLSPSGDDIYVTHIAGRNILRLSTDDFSDSEKLWFGEGGTWEGRMVLLRHVSFPPAGSPLYLLEQGEADPTCVWIYRPGTGERKRTCLPEDARIQGIVASPDGSRLYANGVTELIVLDADGEVISRTDLVEKHRWIAMSADGNTLYLTAATGEEEGLLTCADQDGRVTRKIHLPTPINVIALDGGRDVMK